MGTKLTTQTYLARLRSKRHDRAEVYDYSRTVYETGKKIQIGCVKHGLFDQWPSDHLNNIGCPKCGRDKAKITNLRKYGTTNPASSQVIKDKIKAKFIEVYGVDNPSKCPAIKQQKKDTCYQNFGTRSSTEN